MIPAGAEFVISWGVYVYTQPAEMTKWTIAYEHADQPVWSVESHLDYSISVMTTLYRLPLYLITDVPRLISAGTVAAAFGDRGCFLLPAVFSTLPKKA